MCTVECSWSHGRKLCCAIHVFLWDTVEGLHTKKEMENVEWNQWLNNIRRLKETVETEPLFEFSPHIQGKMNEDRLDVCRNADKKLPNKVTSRVRFSFVASVFDPFMTLWTHWKQFWLNRRNSCCETDIENDEQFYQLSARKNSIQVHVLEERYFH